MITFIVEALRHRPLGGLGKRVYQDGGVRAWCLG